MQRNAEPVIEGVLKRGQRGESIQSGTVLDTRQRGMLPLTALFYLCATLDSARRYWLRRGGQWKGRSQAPVRS